VLLGPNPAKEGLVIKATLPAGWSRLAVYDIAGRLVKMLNQGTHPAGSSQIFAWNGVDDSGRKVTSGTYFARLETPQGNRLARVVLLR
jgi:flagellar hook assembly protein FlgD